MNDNNRPDCPQLFTIEGQPSAAPLPSGDDQTTATLAAMAILAGDAGRRSPLVRGIAEGLARGALGQHRQPRTVDEAAAFARELFALARVKWIFKADPRGIESVTHPDVFAAAITRGDLAAGDCDDRAVFIAAILRAVKLPAVLGVVSSKPAGRFEHVLAGMGAKDSPFWLDAQETRTAGTLPPGVRRLATFAVP